MSSYLCPTAELSGGMSMLGCEAGHADKMPTVFSDLLAPHESARRRLNINLFQEK